MLLNEFKEVSTSSSLNPQKFSSLRCMTHNDQFIAYVNLENSREDKLFCDKCILAEKEARDISNGISKVKNQLNESLRSNSGSGSTYSRPLIIADFKQFLKNLYSFCTLEENDPCRFNSEMLSSLEGGRQQEKLKLFTESVQEVREEMSREFSLELTQLMDKFKATLNEQIEQVTDELLQYIEKQLESLMSRDALGIKQFKERGCKLVLSAVKTAALKDDDFTFQNVESSISRLHSGKIEISYAREHGQKQFKSFLSELDSIALKGVAGQFISQMTQVSQTMLNNFSFLPPKKDLDGSKSITFQYLHSKMNPVTSQITKQNYFNIRTSKSVPGSRLQMQGIRDSPLRGSEERLQQQLQSPYSSLPDSGSKPTANSLDPYEMSECTSSSKSSERPSLFATFSSTLRTALKSAASGSRDKRKHLRMNRVVAMFPDQNMTDEKSKSFSTLANNINNNNNNNNSAILSQNQQFSSQKSDSFKDTAAQLSNKSSIYFKQDSDNSKKEYLQKSLHQLTQSVQFKRISEFFPEQLQPIEPIRSLKTKILPSKSSSQNTTQQEISQNSQCLVIKPFKQEIFAVIRIPSQGTASSSSKQGDTPLSSKEGKTSSSFILAEPDGFINVYNIQGLDIQLCSRERAHKKLLGISIGKYGSMFFTAGEGGQGKYSSVKLWVILSDSSIKELVEMKIQEVNVKDLIFVRESMLANHNKLSLCVWSGRNKIEQANKGGGIGYFHQKSDSMGKMDSMEKTENQSHSGNCTGSRLSAWTLEFSSNGSFDGAKMQSSFISSLPDDILGLAADEEGVLAFSKDTLFVFTYSPHFDSLHKKGIVKFQKFTQSDSIFSARKIVRPAANGPGNDTSILCVTQFGMFYILNDQLSVIQEKFLKDSMTRQLMVSKVYPSSADVSDNLNYFHCYSAENKTFYAIQIDGLKLLDEMHTPTHIKEIFFEKNGRFISFDSDSFQICKPLALKEAAIAFKQRRSVLSEDNGHPF